MFIMHQGTKIGGAHGATTGFSPGASGLNATTTQQAILEVLSKYKVDLSITEISIGTNPNTSNAALVVKYNDTNGIVTKYIDFTN